MPPFPLVPRPHLPKCFWHISRSLPCPKQPLYQSYPPEENQFVYLWRVLHIRHFKPRLACSFTERTSAGLERVEEADRCQQAEEQFKKRWPVQTAAGRRHNNYIYITFLACGASVSLDNITLWTKLHASILVESRCMKNQYCSHFQGRLHFFSTLPICGQGLQLCNESKRLTK